MIVIRNTPEVLPQPCVATIGFFDGVHKGHLFLIDQVKEEAKARSLCSAVITFPVHPRKVMNADYKPQLLTSYEEKIELLAETGIDYCFVLDFTTEISQLSAYRFMKEILKEQLNVQTLVIGHDHRFGHNREEGFEDYCRFGESLSIYMIRARARIINDVTISSSVIRRALEAGNVSQANTYLGYPYFLDGTVVGGYKLGRTIGFPTANLSVNDSDKLIPADGVYAVYVMIEGVRHAGMLYIGKRPTINNGNNRSIEVNIFNFDANIYNDQIRILFIEQTRPDIKFAGKEELIAQLEKDAKIIKGIL